MLESVRAEDGDGWKILAEELRPRERAARRIESTGMDWNPRFQIGSDAFSFNWRVHRPGTLPVHDEGFDEDTVAVHRQ
jgi:hypothetical protein